MKLMLIYLNSRSDCKIISELSINNPTILLKPVICLSNKNESRKSSYI